jgi:DNA-binding CsgD family transcriptional regulator
MLIILYNTKFIYTRLYGEIMALTPEQIAELLKLRALGFSQAEIAKTLETSQQVIAYQLRKLKEQAKSKGTDEVFNAALIGGLAGAAAGIGVVALLELLKNQKE